VSDSLTTIAADFLLLYFVCSFADRARFFNQWLRRIAPDTHQDQANDDALLLALAALPPQKNVGAAARPMG